MFAKNERIGQKQWKRLAMFYLLGVTTLLVPSNLARLAGWDGVFSILLGGGASVLYWWLLQKLRGNLLSKRLNSVVIGTIATVQGAYVSYVLVELLKEKLELPQPGWMLLLLLILLSYATAASGMESRARVFQMLYPIMFFPLLLMLVLAAGSIKRVYVGPFLAHSPMKIIEGAYLVFTFYTTLFYVRLEQDAVTEKRSRGYGVLLGSLIVLLTLYVILLGNFGENALCEMEEPSVTLMSTIQFPGFFVRRLDALMVGVWFGTLYALLSVSIYYGTKALRCFCGTKRQNARWVALLVFAGGLLLQQKEGWVNGMGTYTKWISTPLLVLIPVVFLALQLTGCSMAQLEQRGFPLLIAVSKEADRVMVSYVFSEEILQAEGSSYEAAVVELGKTYNRKLDYNHLKVLLLEDGVVSDEALFANVLTTLEKEPQMPRNLYVCTTKDALTLLEEHKETLANFLEEYLETHRSELKLYTLGDLLDEQKNKRYVIILPEVG